jgi:hypothetical protein
MSLKDLRVRQKYMDTVLGIFLVLPFGLQNKFL